MEGVCLARVLPEHRSGHQTQMPSGRHSTHTVVFIHSQAPTGLKLKLFKVLVISVLLYNSELWTTKQTLLDGLDRWHTC